MSILRAQVIEKFGCIDACRMIEMGRYQFLGRFSVFCGFTFKSVGFRFRFSRKPRFRFLRQMRKQGINSGVQPPQLT